MRSTHTHLRGLKMKKLMFASLATTAVLGLAACAENNNPVDNVREAASDTNLQGKDFASACSVKPLDAVISGLMTGGQASVKSQRTVYSFAGANVHRTTQLYQSADCSGEVTATFDEAGSFEIIDG